MYITLTPEQATDVAFPQGCPVVYSRPRRRGGGKEDALAASAMSAAADEDHDGHCDSLVGAVRSVSIDVSPSALGNREFVFGLQILGIEGSETAREASLRFAPGCPVTVRDYAAEAAAATNDGAGGRVARGEGAASAAENDEIWCDGSVISSYRIGLPPLENNGGNRDPLPRGRAGEALSSSLWLYSAVVVLPGGGEGVFHGIAADSIKFRRPAEDVSAEQGTGQAEPIEVDNSQRVAQQARPEPAQPPLVARVQCAAVTASAVSSDEDEPSMGVEGPIIGGRFLSRKESERSIRSCDTASSYSLENGLTTPRKKQPRRTSSSLAVGGKQEDRVKLSSSVKRRRIFSATEDKKNLSSDGIDRGQVAGSATAPMEPGDELDQSPGGVNRRRRSSNSLDRLGRPLDAGRVGGQDDSKSGSAGNSDMPEIRVIMPSFDAAHTLDVPPWLSTSDVKSHIVGKGGSRHRRLQDRFRCKITLKGKGSGWSGKRAGKVGPGGGPTEYLQVVIKDTIETQNGGIGCIKREIEDALIEYVKASAEHKSIGRLLYELEASKEWEGRRGRSIGPVLSRNYRDPTKASKSHYMDILELPFDNEGNAHGRFLVGAGGSLLSEMRESYGCDIDIVGVFDNDRLRCDPYVIISSIERSAVIAAKKFVLSKIREHQGKCRKKCTLRWQS